MDTYRRIYDDIATALTSVAQVDLDNSQIEHLLQDEVDEAVQSFPAVYISFQQFSFTADADGWIRGEGIVQLRLAEWCINRDLLSIFDLRNQVTQSVQRLKGSDYYSSLVLSQETQETDNNQLVVWTQSYAVEVVDDYQYTSTTIEKAPP